MTLIDFVFPKLRTPKPSQKMTKKSRFRGTFHKKRGKRAQALLKSASQYLFNIHSSLPIQLS